MSRAAGVGREPVLLGVAACIEATSLRVSFLVLAGIEAAVAVAATRAIEPQNAPA